MPLDSTSTYAQIVAAHADNSNYAGTGSLAEAQAYVQACRLLIIKLPKRGRHAGEEIEFDPLVLQNEITAALAWISAHTPAASGGAGVRFFGFEGFRR